MCGIVGKLGPAGTPGRQLQLSAGVLQHRGPDSSGFFAEGNVALGHFRLSIIDLADRSAQPMISSCGRYILIFNGEIYNYLELRIQLKSAGISFSTQSDTEVLLNALVHWGEAALLKLKGVFAFALWDKREETLWLARDRFGEKPLFFTQIGGLFTFASELRALVSEIDTDVELCAQAFNSFLHYQFVHEPLTPFKDIYKLERGYQMVVHGGKVLTNRRYWSFDDIEEVDGSPDELILPALTKAVECMLRSDAKVGTALSAGIDSSAILALSRLVGVEGMECYSVGYPGRPPCDERADAKVFADSMQAKFFDIELDTKEFVEGFESIVSAMGEPIADIAAFGHYSVAKLASDCGAKVMMSGLGGDELFWGYAWPPEAVRMSLLRLQNRENAAQKRGFLASSENRIVRKVRHLLGRQTPEINALPRPPFEDCAVFYDAAPGFLESRAFAEAALLDKSDCKFDGPYEHFRLEGRGEKDVPNFINECLFDGWLVGNCLALTDRVSMHNSVEARVPFLDHDLVNLVFGLRKAHDDHTLGNKAWLKSALKDVVPSEILFRKKQGFTPPVVQWMQGAVREYGQRLLTGSPLHQFIDKTQIPLLFDRALLTGENLQIAYKLTLFDVFVSTFKAKRPADERTSQHN